MTGLKQCSAALLFLVMYFSLMVTAKAQETEFDAFSEADIVKVESENAAVFQRRFRNTRWTGLGMQGITDIDRIPSMEVRARLQTVFGDPTRQLDDLAFEPNFRIAEAIQYEYWFIIDNEIPLMILDIDGPFTRGLVYAVSVSYIDLMPQIKRRLSQLLMEPVKLEEFNDIFFSPEREAWYRISFADGEFDYEEVPMPARFRNSPFDF